MIAAARRAPSVERATGAARDIVFVSLEAWDDIWRRNQFFCRELARRGWRILFVEPAADWSAGLRRRDWTQFARRVDWSPNGLPSLRVTRPVKVMPKSSPRGQRVNHTILRRHIASRTRALRMSRPVLWVNDHSAWRLAESLDASRVLYDVTDDWTQMNDLPEYRELVAEQDRRLCELADHVVVCSPHLLELKRPLARHVSLVPNAVDAAAYGKVSDISTRHPRTTHWRGPVLGYTGTLHADRLDLDLLRRVAARWPGTIALVGPSHLAADQLSDLPNIELVGPVPHEQLPKFMAAMDVLIVPHVVSPFTESLNPLKLWEYLASGKPIVSTPAAGFREHAGHVRLAATAEDFTAQCEAALRDDPVSAAARRREAQPHAWASRVDMVERLMIGGSFGDRSVPASVEVARR